MIVELGVLAKGQTGKRCHDSFMEAVAMSVERTGLLPIHSPFTNQRATVVQAAEGKSPDPGAEVADVALVAFPGRRAGNTRECRGPTRYGTRRPRKGPCSHKSRTCVN